MKRICHTRGAPLFILAVISIYNQWPNVSSFESAIERRSANAASAPNNRWPFACWLNENRQLKFLRRSPKYAYYQLRNRQADDGNHVFCVLTKKLLMLSSAELMHGVPKLITVDSSLNQCWPSLI